MRFRGFLGCPHGGSGGGVGGGGNAAPEKGVTRLLRSTAVPSSQQPHLFQ